MNNKNLELEAIIEERTKHLELALLEIKSKEQLLELRYRQNVNLLKLISHDLANPLQILGMSVEALSDRCPPELLKLVDRMKRSTDTMTQILYLVRELQAFDSGKKELKLESVSIDNVIENSQFIFQDKLKEKNIVLEYVNENINQNESFVCAEKVSLSNNVFNNLISNAIKFSKPNSKINITSVQKDDQIIVKIIDNGIGIPADILPNIFAYDKETSRPGTMGEKGTGFGMPLVKLFLDLYGVKVVVKSQELNELTNDHGTSFELIFKKAV